MVALTEHCHIVRDDQILSGEPVIQGTRTSVRTVVELWRMGKSPEEIPASLPHLNMSQVFDALSYYYDHPEEIENHIRRNQIAEELIHPLVRNL